MDQVVAGNRTETNPNLCHSGDFFDSNMVLHEVFMRYGMDVADEGGVERWVDLWNKVWNCAKARDFLMFKRGDVVEILEEFQDPGDATLTCVVQDHEEKGRVDLAPLEMTGAIKPLYTVKTDWIRLRPPQVH
jgi:hypothetical protein